MDEDKLFYNRLCDLARKRDDKNVPTFSKFLGIEEQVGLKFKSAVFWGGYEGAGRKIIMFLPDWAEPEDFYDSVAAVKITSTDKKVYDHRDYLGSVMGLGLKREVIGDIAPCDDFAVMFCISEIAQFIKENLKLDTSNVPSAPNVSNVYTQNFENVTFSMPNVHGYSDLLTEMQKDPKFEKLILSMTIDRIAGKSSLAKGKSIR